MPNYWADWEPVITDSRLAGVEAIARRRFKDIPEETDFVTFVQPATTRIRRGKEVDVPNLAIFAVASPHPTDPTTRKLSMAALSLDTWQSLDRRWKHMVGYMDPALSVYKRLLPVHLEMLENLRALLPSDPRLMN